MQYINKLTPERFAKIFKAVSDPSRQKIMLLLRRKGEVNVGALVKKLNFAQPTVSQHLKVLKDAGALTSRKVGQEVYYAICSKAICETMTKFMEYYKLTK